MRERLIVAFIGLTVLVIALYGVPRAYFLADFVRDEEQRALEVSAELIATQISELERNDVTVTDTYLEKLLSEDESIEYLSPEGSRLAVGPRLATEDVSSVILNVPGGGKLTLSRAQSFINERVSRALLPLVLIGLALVALSALAGFVLARALARPFQHLAGVAQQLGRGKFGLEVPHYRIPEANQIGTALRDSAHDLGVLMRREREFAANASHQLRTPITALRLDLEDLSLWPETPPGVSTELKRSLTELDRLNSAVTELLDLARGQRMGSAVDVDLTALVADTVARWQSQAGAHGHRIEHKSTGAVPANVVPGPVSQILDVLIDNACKYGAGKVTVETADADAHIRITVTDEGRRTFGNEIFRRAVRSSGGTGEGIGLTIASELAKAMGGHLTLAPDPTTTFVLMLAKPQHNL